jgi:hypothetical protein
VEADKVVEADPYNILQTADAEVVEPELERLQREVKGMEEVHLPKVEVEEV